jgi:hypothetical protein
MLGSPSPVRDECSLGYLLGTGEQPENTKAFHTANATRQFDANWATVQLSY